MFTKILDGNGNIKCRRKHNIQLDSSDRGKSCVEYIVCDTEGSSTDDICNAVEDGFLCLVLRRYGVFGFLFRLWQSALIDLLILIQGNMVYLHRDRRDHIRRLILFDEFRKRINVHRLIRNNVSRNILSAACFVKRLNGSVLYAGEFTYDPLYLSQLDTEAPDFYLSVVSSDEVHDPSPENTDDISCPVSFFISGLIRERIADKYLCGLFGTVQISSADLMTGNYKLARNTERQTVHIPVNNILLHIAVLPAKRNTPVQLINNINMRTDGTLGRTVSIDKTEPGSSNRHKLFSAYNKDMRILGIREQIGKLSSHLSCHKGVCYLIGIEIVLYSNKVKTYFLVYDM